GQRPCHAIHSRKRSLPAASMGWRGISSTARLSAFHVIRRWCRWALIVSSRFFVSRNHHRQRQEEARPDNHDECRDYGRRRIVERGWRIVDRRRHVDLPSLVDVHSFITTCRPDRKRRSTTARRRTREAAAATI